MTKTMRDDDARRKLGLAAAWGFACIICGRPFASVASITVEHIVPRSRGGTGRDNKAPSHYRCNMLRGTRPLVVAAREVEAKLLELGGRSASWLNAPVPHRNVPPAAMLDPVDASWWFLADTWAARAAARGVPRAEQR